LFGGGVATFRYFAYREEAKVQALEEQLFTPYWAAIRASDFDKAVSFHSQDWLKKHTKEELAEAYAEAIEKHGSFDESHVRTAQRFYEPGMEGQAMKVRTIVTFHDGWLGEVNYNLTRATDADAWKLDQSFTSASFPLGDGPY